MKERAKFQFRAEMCNIFNHWDVGNRNETWNTAAFGNIAQTTIDNRDIQFGARLVF
jgi:hypothetical protein